jgi:hypothetical protein
MPIGLRTGYVRHGRGGNDHVRRCQHGRKRRYNAVSRHECGPLAIAVGLQDRTDRGVGAGADLERAGAGGLKPLGPIALGQPKDADAGAEALLGMGLLGEDELDERRRVAPDLTGLPLQALRRPVRVALVARRHVLAHRRVLAVEQTRPRLLRGYPSRA